MHNFYLNVRPCLRQWHCIKCGTHTKYFHNRWKVFSSLLMLHAVISFIFYPLFFSPHWITLVLVLPNDGLITYTVSHTPGIMLWGLFQKDELHFHIVEYQLKCCQCALNHAKPTSQPFSEIYETELMIKLHLTSFCWDITNGIDMTTASESVGRQIQNRNPIIKIPQT